VACGIWRIICLDWKTADERGLGEVQFLISSRIISPQNIT
jgi:hypothetical protein